MRPINHYAAPIPHDLPLDLPLPREVLLVALVVTFLMHILFVNLMVGASLFTFVFEAIGHYRKRPQLDRLAYQICQTITVNKSLAVVLGVGPLLMMNLAYTLHFYAANAMTGIAWILVVPSVSLAFLLTYAQKFLWHSMDKRLHLAIGATTSALFLFIPLIFLTNINLMLFPEHWSRIQGFVDALFMNNVWPRYAHFLLASLSITSLYLICRLPSAETPPAELKRLFYRIARSVTASSP